MNKHILRGLALVGAFGASAMAHAESTAAVAAVDGAKTDALAVCAALLAMGIAVWAALFLYRKFFK